MDPSTALGVCCFQGGTVLQHTQICSVGIDIGTSTTQLIFSRLSVQNTAGYFSVPRAEITGKEVFFRSPVFDTPLLDASRIDSAALRRMIEGVYADAGIRPAQVQTGAVVITGETARRENARAVLEQISSLAGDFVVSTAGPDLEAVLAGQGSGAQQYSRDHSAAVVNLDIGGGTTNIAVFDCGRVAASGCLDIGGRQVSLTPDGKIRAVYGGAQKVAAACQIPLAPGQPASQDALERLCDGMNDVLEQLLGLSPPSTLLGQLTTPGSTPFSLPPDITIGFLSFSGGVADCIMQPPPEPFAYHDIGVLLGRAIRRGRLFGRFRVLPAAETIRATVVGAGTCTTRLSGSTIAYDRGLFPLRNIPVLRLDTGEEHRVSAGDAALLHERAAWFLRQNDSALLLLALEGPADPTYPQLETLAAAITAGLDDVLPEGAPLLVLTRRDVAKALGQLLRRKAGRPVIAVDGIDIGGGQFIDLGAPVLNGMAVPAIVKTLIFES